MPFLWDQGRLERGLSNLLHLRKMACQITGKRVLRHWKAQEQGLWSPEDNRVLCKDARCGSAVVDCRQGGEGWPEQGFGNIENQEAGKEWLESKEAAEEDGERGGRTSQESRPSLGHC